MATFLLWNVNRKPLDGLIVRLVQQHKVHVLVLIEPPDTDDTLLQALNGIARFVRVQSHERFGVYTRWRESSFERLEPPVSNQRMDFYRLRVPRSVEILLAVVHGLDRVNYADARRGLFFQRVVSNVAWAEELAGHQRTIVVGDFNANPFEESIGGISGLHAIRMKAVGGRAFRTVLEVDYPFFYNPMWGCYGRARDAAPATYYWNGSDVHEVFWHMLDQVVIRPHVLPIFREDRLKILRKVGSIDFLTSSGFPDEMNASDHLPVVFELKGGERNA